MRGVPATGSTSRMIINGRYIRPELQNRGAKSVILTWFPAASVRKVSRIAVLRR